MSASTSTGRADANSRLKPATPPFCSSWSAVVPACTRWGQRDGRGRRVTGTPANVAAGSPVRPLRSRQDRYPSASVESAAPPSVEELRQVVPVSDMRGRLGAGPARCRMADGYWLPTGAAGSSVSRSEPSNALLPPAARTGRGSVDANMRVETTYRPRRLGGVRPGLALLLVPRGPSPFSSTPHKRPHRPDRRRPSLSPYRRHLPGSLYLLTYTPVVDSVAGQPAAEDEGVLQ
jgi:hypothetical protein